MNLLPMKWSLVFAILMVETPLALSASRKPRQKRGRKSPAPFLIIPKHASDDPDLEFTTIMDARRLLLPAYPYFQVYQIFSNESFVTEPPPFDYSYFARYKDEPGMSSLIDDIDNRTTRTTKRGWYFLSLKLTCDDVIKKVINYYQRYVILNRKCALPIRDIHRDFERGLNRITLEMKGGKVYNLSRVHVAGRAVTINRTAVTYVIGEARMDELKFHFSEYMLSVVSHNSKTDSDDDSLQERIQKERGSFLLVMKKILLSVRISIQLVKQCKAKLDKLTLSSIDDFSINFSNDLDLLKTKGFVETFVKEKLLWEFKRILRVTVAKDFGKAIIYTDICRYAINFWDSMIEPPIFMSHSSGDPNDDFPKFEVPEL